MNIKLERERIIIILENSDRGNTVVKLQTEIRHLKESIMTRSLCSQTPPLQLGSFPLETIHRPDSHLIPSFHI